jgi:hypothetical protein
MGRVLRWLIAALIVFLFTSFVLAQHTPSPHAHPSAAQQRVLKNSIAFPKE